MLSKPILFLATANHAESKKFYESKLGLTFVSEDYFAIVFDISGMELKIQKVESLTNAEYTMLGWSVDNIENTVKKLRTRGVEIEAYDQIEQDELGIWESPNGAKIAWFKDPDGNCLSITEH